MELEDRIFGTEAIQEPVLRELIASGPVQRLKDVSQSGPVPFFIDGKPEVKRFDHSIGVMILLRRHGATLQEQIAGLLHDVPHTAFSHVADFVFEDERHEYHERFMEEVVRTSEIPAVLERHGFAVEAILDEENFPLLERPLPRLCADRLDYAMRDLELHGLASTEEFRRELTVRGNEFVFQRFEPAERFGLKFIELDENVYASPREIAIFELFARILRAMLDAGELEREELFRTDTYVMEKVRNSDNESVASLLEVLESGPEIDVGVEDHDFIGGTKPRAVDPPFVEEGRKIPASERSERLGERIDQHVSEVEEGFRITVEGLDSSLM